MSDLQKLKATVQQLSNTARQTSSALGNFDQQFKRYNDQVRNAVGGSSQRKDQEMMVAIAQAQKAVQQANQAVQQAARIAQQYSASL